MARKVWIVSAVTIVSVVATIAAWTVCASVLLCKFTGNMPSFVFPYAQWFMLAPEWWLTNWFSNVCIVGSAAIPTIVLLLVGISGITAWLRRRKLRRPFFGGLMTVREGATENHGRARWPSMKEMMRRYPPPPPQRGGVVMCQVRRVDEESIRDVPFNSDDRRTWGLAGKTPLLIHDPMSGLSAAPHSFWCIGTGGMKTMMALSTQYHFRGSIITFDPSCEIGPMVKRWREKIGQRVVFIGKDAKLGQQGIDVLDCIRPGTTDAASRILSMTASICGEEKSRSDKNSVFDSAGRNIIACLLAHMMYDKGTDEKTIETLVKGITIPEDEMQAKLKEIHHSSDSIQARQLAGIVMGTHKETFSGAYFSATQHAGFLLDPDNARLLSGTLKPSEILAGGLSVYIQIPTGSLIYVPGPGRVITDSFVSAVLQANGNAAELMLLMADEARLLENMKSVEVVLTQGRKYKLALNFIYTSINDMKRIWTEDGLEMWLDNCEWSGYAAVGSKTAKWLSGELGKRGVLAISAGVNRGSSGQALGSASRSRGSNSSEHEIGKNLMNPDDFKDSRRDEVFILNRTGRAYRGGLPAYFMFDYMDKEIGQSSYRMQKDAA